MSRRIFLLPLVLCCIVAACENHPTSFDQRTNVIMPLAVGNTWIYRLKTYDSAGNAAVTGFDTLAIVAEETRGGATWYRANTGVLYRNTAEGLWINECACDSLAGRPAARLAAKYPAARGDRFGELPATTVLINNTPVTQRIATQVTTTDTSVSVAAGTYRCHGYEFVILEPDSARFLRPQAHYYAVNLGRTVTIDKNNGKAAEELLSATLR